MAEEETKVRVRVTTFVDQPEGEQYGYTAYEVDGGARVGSADGFEDGGKAIAAAKKEYKGRIEEVIGGEDVHPDTPPDPDDPEKWSRAATGKMESRPES